MLSIYYLYIVMLKLQKKRRYLLILILAWQEWFRKLYWSIIV